MSLQANLLLPDNLQSSLLRADFINRGDVYSTQPYSNDISGQPNRHSLTFGFEIVDSDTYENVPLGRIKSLQISNDPLLDPASTIALSNWPAGSFSVATDYTLTLNPSYFFDATLAVESGRSEQTGVGLYRVDNWPLSGDGGPSSVYFKAVLLSAAGDEVAYSGAAAIRDDILWETLKPSTPGQPISVQRSWTGRRTSYTFRASEEGSSGLYGAGVAAYLADVLDVGYDSATSLPMLVSTKAASLTGVKRTLAPNVPAWTSALALTGYSYNSGADTYTADSGRTVGTSQAVNSSSGLAFQSATPLTLTSASPDFACQVQASVVLASEDVSPTFVLKVVSVSSITSPSTARELYVKVNIPYAGAPTASLYQRINATQTMIQSLALPMASRESFLAGGTLELYLTNATDPVADGVAVLQAYFSPDSDRTQSFLLGSALVSAFTQHTTLAVGYVCYSTGGVATVNVGEIVLAGGSFSQSVDLGDCLVDDAVEISSPVTQTLADGWAQSVSSGDWLAYSQNHAYVAPSAIASRVVTLTANPSPSERDIIELQSGMPSMSDRARIDVGLDSHESGDFYVAFSPSPSIEQDTSPRPLGARCDDDFAADSEPLGMPTLAVVLSTLKRTVEVVERRCDNTLVVRSIFPYVAQGAPEKWAFEINNCPRHGSADECVVTVWRNDEVIGSTSVGAFIRSKTLGLGYYAAFGVRSERTAGIDPAETSLCPGLAIVSSVIFRGLPPIANPDTAPAASSRHFILGNTGAAYSKPWLGQFMIAGLTDKIDQDDFVVPKLSAAFPSATVATTGFNIDFSSPPSTLDGYSLSAGNYVLVKDQDHSSKNGIYVVVSPAVWQRTADLNSSVPDYRYRTVKVLYGAINGDTTWYLEDYSGDFVVGVTPCVWRTNLFAQCLTIDAFSSSLTSLAPQMLELRMEQRDSNTPLSTPRVRFYSDLNGGVGTPLTGWFSTDRTLSTPQRTSGSLVPWNDLIQISLLDKGLSVSQGGKIWLAIQVPSDCRLATANGKNRGEISHARGTTVAGWNIVKSAWHKLFLRSVRRKDHSIHLAASQVRMRALSHAKVNSDASGLSATMRVDIQGPKGVSTPRPIVSTSLVPAVRSAVLSISAADDDSGILAFRVGKECDSGCVNFSSWQPWGLFATANGAQYTTYLYGTPWNTPQGSYNSTILAQNMGGDGPRRIWVQVMDVAGNVSETFPITVLAQSNILIDTTAPAGSAAFTSGIDGSPLSITNEKGSWLAIRGSDRITAPKDVRTRLIGAGETREWSGWSPADDHLPFDFEEAEEDGLKRLEIQFRDFGNNTTQVSPTWDALRRSSDMGVTYVAMERWTAPIPGAVESLYISGIQVENFSAYQLVDSQHPDYASGTAFYVVSSSASSLGRRVLLRSNDIVSIVGTATSFTIAQDRGLLVFSSPISVNGVTASVKRTSAIIDKWDGVAILRVANLGPLGERVVLSLCSAGDHLFLGGGSGNLWTYNGRVINGPVYTTASGSTKLPITVIVKHQFNHESEAHLYLATGVNPRLFRSPLASAVQGGSWARIVATDDLNAPNCNITCAATAWDTLFFGNDSGSIWRYVRRPNKTNVVADMEGVFAFTLKNHHLKDGDPSAAAVQCMVVSGGQLLAGIGNKPEIWSYSQTLRDSAVVPETWARQYFDRSFANDPMSWQHYDSTGKNPRQDDNFIGVSVSDPYFAHGYRDMVLLKSDAGDFVSYSCDTGSDWARVMSAYTPSGILQSVRVGTAAPVANVLTAAPNVVDGVSMVLGDRVLVRTHTNAALNGIYTITSVGTGANGVWARAVDLNSSDEFVGNRLVTVQQGDTLKLSRWLLRVSSPFTLGTAAVSWVQPSYNIEFQAQLISGVGKQGFQVSDGHHLFDVSLGNGSIRVQSGSKIAEADFAEVNPFSAFAVTSERDGGGIYPERGVKKIWNFANLSGDDTDENRGPYFTGASYVPHTYDPVAAKLWTADRFVVPYVSGSSHNLAGNPNWGTESVTTASFTRVTHSLRVELALKGDPRIVQEDIEEPILIDTHTKMMVRIRFEPSAPGQAMRIPDALLRVSYGAVPGAYHQWFSAPVNQAEGYHTYILKPSYQGGLKGIALEVSGLPEGPFRPRYAYIDFIAIVSDSAEVQIKDNLTPIRVGVEGRTLKVWVGKTFFPKINEDLFLSLPTDSVRLRFGKIDPNEGPSTWAWGGVAFSTDLPTAPAYRDELKWALQWRFGSTGGVRCLLNHQGTAYALTDGIREMRKADSPEDRAIKAWTYEVNTESWRLDLPSTPRELDGTGTTRALAAIDFRGTLIVSGQQANIRFA